MNFYAEEKLLILCLIPSVGLPIVPVFSYSLQTERTVTVVIIISSSFLISPIKPVLALS